MMLLLAAIFGISVLNLLLLAYLYERMRRMEALMQAIITKEDADGGDEPLPGMDLMLLRPKTHRKARRFTDKTRDWIAAHETASRR